MKKNKATLLLALLAALLLCACAKEPSSPEDTAPQSEEETTNERDLGALLGEEKNESYRYRKYERGIVLTRYLAEETAVVVPAKIDGVAVRGIGENTFSRQNFLISVSIPDSIFEIAQGAFAESPKLTVLTVSENNRWYVSIDNVLYDAEKTTLLAFAGGNALSEFTVPNTVTLLGRQAFAGAVNLRCVTLGATIKDYGTGTFSSCSALESVILEDETLRVIPEDFFNGCISLHDFSMPPAVERIGARAFQLCSALESITLPRTLTELGDNAFGKCQKLKEIAVPDSVKTMGESVFTGCDHMQSASLPKSMTVLPADTFSFCYALHSISLPEQLSEIGANAFYHCMALRSLPIPTTVVKIGAEAFKDCYGFGSIYIPATVKSIGKDVFLLGNPNAKPRKYTTVRCAKGSAAMEYCIENEVPYTAS